MKSQFHFAYPYLFEGWNSQPILFSIGFLAQVYPKAQFEAVVLETAKQIAQNAPLTLRAAKAAIRMVAALPQAPSLAECDVLAASCFDSADYAEGRTAFLEKRSANFTGL